MSEIVFRWSGQSDDPWEAYHAAAAWCEEHGYSVGSMQRGAPTGVMKGEYAIAKWRNLDEADRAALDGAIESIYGTFRDCDVVLKLKAEAQPELEGE